MMEKEGYRVIMHKVNSVDEFMEAWDNMDESTKAVLIFAHSNGNALLFEEGTAKNAMSWNGKNSKQEQIGDIRNLKGPEIDEVYLMSCNTANEMLLEFQGGNIAHAFHNLPNVKNVYGYDGSMSFPDTLYEFLMGYYDPRLSDDDEQETFYSIKEKYAVQLAESLYDAHLSHYDGWILHTDKED